MATERTSLLGHDDDDDIDTGIPPEHNAWRLSVAIGAFLFVIYVSSSWSNNHHPSTKWTDATWEQRQIWKDGPLNEWWEHSKGFLREMDIPQKATAVEDKAQELGKDIQQEVVAGEAKAQELGSNIQQEAVALGGKTKELGKNIQQEAVVGEAKAKEWGSGIQQESQVVAAKAQELGSNIQQKAVGAKGKAQELETEIQQEAQVAEAKAQELGSNIQQKAVGAKGKAQELKTEIQQEAQVAEAKAQEWGSDIQQEAQVAEAKAQEWGSDIQQEAQIAEAKAQEWGSDIQQEAQVAEAKAQEWGSAIQQEARVAEAKAQEWGSDIQQEAQVAEAKAQEWGSDIQQEAVGAKAKAQELGKNIQQEAKGVEAKAQEWGSDTKQRLNPLNGETKIQEWGNDVQLSLSNVEGATEATSERIDEWFQKEWQASGQEVNKVESAMPRLWNRTVTSEQDFSHHVLSNLKRFGQTLRSFWQGKNWKQDAANETEKVQGAFENWWQNSRAAERAWWGDTVEAYHKFEDREALWWNATEGGIAKDWNATRSWEEQEWNTTKSWFARKAEQAQPIDYFNHSEAYRKLVDGYGWMDNDYLKIVNGWDVQINQAYCALASVAAVLNSFQVEVKDPIYEPYFYATQEALLNNSCVYDNVVRKGGLFRPPGGLTLEQAAALIHCHADNVDVQTVHVDWSVPLTQVQQDWEQAIRDPNSRVIVNYDRRVLGQAGGGHFSPLGVWRKDTVLVLDVAKYKYPPVWVSTARLFAAMATMDACGEWSFPEQQDKVPSDLMESHQRADYEQALELLDCKARPRGYLIVRQKL